MSLKHGLLYKTLRRVLPAFLEDPDGYELSIQAILIA